MKIVSADILSLIVSLNLSVSFIIISFFLGIYPIPFKNKIIFFLILNFIFNFILYRYIEYFKLKIKT